MLLDIDFNVNLLYGHDQKGINMIRRATCQLERGT